MASGLTPSALGARPCRPSAGPPILFVIVDTEEEFDWNAPMARYNTAVTAVRRIDRVQRIFERYRVRPTYVVDFPVASQADGFLPLRDLADSGGCDIGAHLHPWVNPPFEEILNARNSFPCNLPGDLERRKTERLVEAIGDSFGRWPRVYKAGRYGFGSSTAATLECLGFDVDTSINPHMDFTGIEGPSFVSFDSRPFFFGQTQPLLELPCTVGHVGILGPAGRHVHRLASWEPFDRLRAVGALSRLRLTNRVMLSPEGNSLREMQQLTEALVARGVRTLSLTFHSPSAVPGHTPYVTTRADLNRFLGRIDAYLQFFFGRLGGTTCTPEVFKARAEAQATASIRPEVYAS